MMRSSFLNQPSYGFLEKYARHDSIIKRKCRDVASDQRARPSDLRVWKRRDAPSSSFPELSTNSRLLGLRPSVATAERERSPKAGTGHPHGITLVPPRVGCSNRSTRVGKVAFIAIPTAISERPC